MPWRPAIKSPTRTECARARWLPAWGPSAHKEAAPPLYKQGGQRRLRCAAEHHQAPVQNARGPSLKTRANGSLFETCHTASVAGLGKESKVRVPRFRDFPM